MTQEFKQEVLRIFEKEKTLFITEDGHVFKKSDKGFCKSHCDTNNIQFEELTKEAFIKKFEKQASSELSDSIEFENLDKLSNADLKKMASTLGVKAKSNKSVDLIEAINTYRDEQEELAKSKSSLSAGEDDGDSEDYEPTNMDGSDTDEEKQTSSAEGKGSENNE